MGNSWGGKDEEPEEGETEQLTAAARRKYTLAPEDAEYMTTDGQLGYVMGDPRKSMNAGRKSMIAGRKSIMAPRNTIFNGDPRKSRMSMAGGRKSIYAADPMPNLESRNSMIAGGPLASMNPQGARKSVYAGNARMSMHPGNTKKNTVYFGDPGASLNHGNARKSVYAGAQGASYIPEDARRQSYASDARPSIYSGEPRSSLKHGNARKSIHAGDPGSALYPGDARKSIYTGNPRASMNSGNTRKSIHAGDPRASVYHGGARKSYASSHGAGYYPGDARNSVQAGGPGADYYPGDARRISAVNDAETGLDPGDARENAVRRSSMNSQPRGSIASQPRGSIASQPRGSIASQPRGSIASKPRGSLISQPRGSLISQPRNSIISEHAEDYTIKPTLVVRNSHSSLMELLPPDVDPEYHVSNAPRGSQWSGGGSLFVPDGFVQGRKKLSIPGDETDFELSSEASFEEDDMDDAMNPYIFNSMKYLGDDSGSEIWEQNPYDNWSATEDDLMDNEFEEHLSGDYPVICMRKGANKDKLLCVEPSRLGGIENSMEWLKIASSGYPEVFERATERTRLQELQREALIKERKKMADRTRLLHVAQIVIALIILLFVVLLFIMHPRDNPSSMTV